MADITHAAEAPKLNGKTQTSNIFLRVRSMSSESLKTTFEIIGLLVLALTFVDAYAVWHFANRANEEQKQQLRIFETNLPVAKTELAK